MRIGLLGFAVTTAILVPAATLSLVAGPDQRAKLFAPGSQTLVVDGAHVTAKLDHKLVDTGDSIHVALTTDKQVELGIVVFAASGSEGDRVPSPPIGVAHEVVRVTPGATKDIAVQLLDVSARSRPLHAYTVFVMSPKEANQLQALQDAAQPPRPSTDPTSDLPSPGEGTDELYRVLGLIQAGTAVDATDAPPAFLPGSVARLEAWGRPTGSGVAIVAPDTAAVDRVVEVAVAVANPTRKHRQVEVSLEFPPIDDSYLGLPEEAATVEPARVMLELANGKVGRATFKVTVHRTGVLGIHARAWCVDQELSCYDKLREGSFEAIEIVESTPAVAAVDRK